MPQFVNVEAGKTAEVVLTLKPAIRVRGLVVELGTGKPIRGVRVAVAIAETGAMTTAEDGRYEGYVGPDPTFVSARQIPPGFVRPMFGPRQLKIREGDGDDELPPFELVRGGDVTGLVLSPDDRATAGAIVEASWSMTEPGPRGTYRAFCPVRPGWSFCRAGQCRLTRRVSRCRREAP